MKQNSAAWRAIGQAYEQLASEGVPLPDSIDGRDIDSFPTAVPNVRHGLCWAAASMGLPSYHSKGAVPMIFCLFGPTYHEVGRSGCRRAAVHRALMAYLVAEMLDTGDCPLCP